MQASTSPPSRRFSLPGLAWTAAAVCAFAPLSGLAKLAIAGDLTGYGLVAGLIIAAGFVLVPLAVAWLAWRLGPRHPRTAVTGFVGALCLLVATAVWRVVSATQARDAEIARQTRALATQLVRRETTDAAAPATPTHPAAQPIVEAQRAVKAQLDAVQLAYDEAADAVASATFFDLRPLVTSHAIAERRRRVDVFVRANQLLLEAAEMGAFHFSTELRRRGVSEPTVRDAVAAYRSATKNHLPRVKQLRDADGALALLMNQFLDFAETHLGTWRHAEETDALLFDDRATKDSHDDLLRTARLLESQRQQLRASLLR